MTLCTPCQALYDGWLDFKQPARGYVTLNNPQRSVEAYKAQTGKTWELIRNQCDAVLESCRRNHHAPVPVLALCTFCLDLQTEFTKLGIDTGGWKPCPAEELVAV